MAEITAGGVRFHVQRLAPHRAGRQANLVNPVAFVHGLALDNLASFYYTLAHPVARAGAEVILYDQRGHGLSERPRTGYRLSDSAADLTAILDTLGVEDPVHLVGYSYGGAIALRFAAACPERVASMVLIEAHVPVPGWGEQMAARITKAGLDLVEGDSLRLMAPGRKQSRLAAAGRGLINHTTLVTDLMATEPLSERELGMFTCPVRAVYGERSDILCYAHLLSRLLSRCTLTVLPGLDHWVLANAAPALRAIVLEWLATRGAGSSR